MHHVFCVQASRVLCLRVTCSVFIHVTCLAFALSVGAAGERYMDDLDVSYGSAWDLWSNQVAIMGMIVGFLTLAYIQMRRIPKWK